MTRPYDLYLRYAVTRGCESAEEVNELLDDLILPKIKKPEFDIVFNYVHRLLPKPISDQIANKQSHGDFMRWMKVLEISDLWFHVERRETHRFMKLTYDIHQDVQMRLMINCLLLKGSKHKDICSEVNSKFSGLLKPIHITAYQKYFFNIPRMTRKDWKSYVPKTRQHETAMLFCALTSDIDIVRTNLGLTSKADISGNLQFFFTTSCERAKDYLKVKSPEMDEQARKWIKAATELADKYAKHRTGDIEDFSKTLQLEFEYVENDFDTPDDAVIAEIKAKDKLNDHADDDKGGES